MTPRDGSDESPAVSASGTDPFAGFDTPTIGAAAGKKLCMVCMDRDRGERKLVRSCRACYA